MYEAHFGLADLPFHIAPDPRFYVDAAPHRAALDALLRGLGRGDEFMLLTAEFGAGKTTVARRLVELVDHDEVAVGELSGLRTEGDDLLNRIAEALGERNFDADHRLGALIGLLEKFGHDGRHALLVIDEAHGVGLDALRRLRKLTAVRVEGHGVLHVCFFGRSAPPGIEDLERLGRPLAIGTTVHLDPLDAAGTREYILHRLKRAGWAGRPAFDVDATDEVHRLCEGNPGRINRLCAHILLQLYMNGRDDTSREIVRAVDELMKSELEGEGLPVDLPPPAAEAHDIEPDTVLEPRSRLEDEDYDRVEIEGLSTHGFSQTLPAVRPPMPLMTTRPWTGRSPAGRASQRVAQLLAAVLLMVGGGVIWQAIGGRGLAGSDAARLATQDTLPAAPAAPGSAAAGLAALAEQTMAQQPTAAGQVTAAAAAPPAGAHAAPPSATQVVTVTRRAPEAAREVATVDRGRRRGRLRTTEAEPAPAAEPATTPAPALDTAPASGRPRAAVEAGAAAAVAACTEAAETMGLCARGAAREQARASAREAQARAPAPPPQAQVPAPAPAQATPQALAQPAPQAAPPPAPQPRPACEPTRAALGLCPD
jgi:type II secretory pathway predicted ATPase ExeA